MRKVFSNFFFVIGLAVWIGGGMLVFRSCTDTTEADDDPSRSSRYACRQAVRAALDNPRSADFEAGFLWYAEQISDVEWRIQPRLTAENAFGGTVRLVFDCRTLISGGYVEVMSLRLVD